MARFIHIPRIVHPVICEELKPQERADYLTKLDDDIRNGKLELADLEAMLQGGWITDDELDTLVSGEE